MIMFKKLIVSLLVNKKKVKQKLIMMLLLYSGLPYFSNGEQGSDFNTQGAKGSISLHHCISKFFLTKNFGLHLSIYILILCWASSAMPVSSGLQCLKSHFQETRETLLWSGNFYLLGSANILCMSACVISALKLKSNVTNLAEEFLEVPNVDT